MILTSPIFSIVAILLLSLISVLFFQKLKLPSILGYLLVGIILGKSGIDLFYLDNNLKLLAEFGIVFLLFTIGLELSFDKLSQQRKNIILVGGLQVIIGTIFPAIVAWFLGMRAQGAIIASAAIALSSTAIITKLLAEQNEFHTNYGRLSFAILLFQDIAAVPFLIIIPTLGSGAADNEIIYLLALMLLKGFAALLFMILFGKNILPFVYRRIAKSKSSEIFMLTTLVIILIAALITHSMGLSFALGAFLAGVALGESAYLEEIQRDIKPFKDVLLGFFFITVGAQLDIFSIGKNWYWVIFLLTMITLFKSVSISFIASFFGRVPPKTAIRTGIILSHSGEFGFALLTLGMQYNIFKEDYAQVILAGIITSMCLSPFIVTYNNQIADKILKYIFPKKNPSES